MQPVCRLLIVCIVALGGEAASHAADPEKNSESPYRLRRHVTGLQGGPSFAVSADGKRYAASSTAPPKQPNVRPTVDVHFVVWDLEAGKKIGEVKSRDAAPSSLFALSPNGRQLAFTGIGRNVSVADVSTGKEIQSFHGSGGAVFAMTFSPDGKLLAETSHDSVNVWDIATGKKVREFEEDGQFCAVAFSPDGNSIVASAVGAEQPIYAWNIATGKPLASYGGMSAPVAVGEPGTQPGAPRHLRVGFTSDGGRIFLAGRDTPAFGLWDVDTGRLLYRSNRPGNVRDSTFSPDGRTVLIADGAEARLHDVLTGKPRGQLDRVYSRLDFSGNGTILFARDEKGISLWEVAPPRAANGSDKLTAPQLEGLWADLRTDDPGHAVRATTKLLGDPSSAVAYFKKHARPAPKLDPQRIAQLIRDLDSAKFAVRQRATEDLQKLGAIADAALRQVLAGKPPLEVRQRIEQILQQGTSPYPTANPDWLQTIRAIEVLEQIGSPEARKVLAKLAAGAPKAPITEEAKGALRRLGRKAG